MIALLILVVLIGLIVLRTPVSFAIMASGLLGLLLLNSFGQVNGIMEVVPVSSIQSLSLSAIPLFILMAHLLLMSGLMDSLFDAGQAVFGRVRGGTGIASTMAGVGFSAVSGSSTAAAATLAKTSSKRMIAEGYRPETATGIVASVGTLAGMIPPSIILVFYAVTAEASVGDLIIAGIVPGLIIAAALLITMFLPMLRNPEFVPAGQSTTLSAKAKALVPALPIGAIFAVVIGAIFLGIATPTEAAALGCISALVLVMARRRFSVAGAIEAVLETVKTSAMIFAIVIAAHVFGHAFTETKVADEILDWVADLPVPSLVIMLMIMCVYVILGFFMDQVAIIALTVPIVLPVVEAMGYDAVWFGVFVVLMGEIGLITPPLGLNVFVVARAAGRDTIEVFRGCVPYVVAMIAVAVLFILVPDIVTWLPNLL